MYKEIIKEICENLNIKCTILSKNWVIMLEKNNETRYITGCKFDLNSHASGNIVDDKYAMYEVLKSKNIPVCEHKIMYSEFNHNDYAKDSQGLALAYEYFNHHNNNIVIKSNTGTCGRNVYHVTEKNQIDDIFSFIFKKNYSISMCPFYNIEEEYRIIILKGKPQIVYSKKRPCITGDGIHTISELLHEFNPHHNFNINNDYVLPKGETYSYTWHHNLSHGSTINLNVENKEFLQNLAIKTAKILNLDFGSVDIIKTGDNYYVLECNSGVMMNNLIKILPNGYNIAKEIYKQAIIELFKKH